MGELDFAATGGFVAHYPMASPAETELALREQLEREQAELAKQAAIEALTTGCDPKAAEQFVRAERRLVELRRSSRATMG